jgi:broad specificity phosphatase PhoE
MPTRIFLLRHGDTGLSRSDAFTGSMDVPLSDDGQAHANELGERLSTFDIAAVYASSMQRARETAEAIASRHNLPVQTLDALREIDHGHWDGLTRAEITTLYPDELEKYNQDPLHFCPQGGESPSQCLDRAYPALMDIVRAHTGQNLVVVAHQGTNLLLITKLVGGDLNRYSQYYGQRPACVNVVDLIDEEHAQLSLLNDVSHYVIGAPPHTPYVV